MENGVYQSWWNLPVERRNLQGKWNPPVQRQYVLEDQGLERDQQGKAIVWYPACELPRGIWLETGYWARWVFGLIHQYFSCSHPRSDV